MDATRSRRGKLRAQILSGLTLFTLLLIHAAPLRAQGALKVMTQGLGAGTVQATAGSVINCGLVCDQNFASATSVTLQATAGLNSVFEKWFGDCASAVGNTCTFTMSGNRSVRAQFRTNPDIPPIGSFLAPADIQAYLTANPQVTTAAQFVRALPEEFRKGWILMSRSESLQTGTARFPRILLPSADGSKVFTLGLSTHDSYPGAHPDAIEYMQWDGSPGQKNFRFHEIVLNPIPAMGRVNQFPARARGVSTDEQRCTRCHSTRNIRNPDLTDAGTTGTTGLVRAKNKPNWDTYDSWGGMLPFNRDKVFKGSVEAAALRKLLNPWTWRNDAPSRRIMEQLALQSNLPSDTTIYPTDDVFRRLDGGTSDGSIQFAFDGGAVVTSEPVPVGSAVGPITYSFNGVAGVPPGTNIQRDSTTPVIMHAFGTPTSGEGRGVQLFDQLGGADSQFNATRIGNELSVHRWATGSVPLDVRPLALALNQGCIVTDSAGNISTTGGAPAFTGDLSFFTARHGMNLAAVIADTSARSRDLPRRKADIEKLNLDRSGDNYLLDSSMTPDIDLLAEYGPFTDFGTTAGIDRLRQEVFRRDTGGFSGDTSIMGGGFYVDREDYGYNTNRIALFRYLLEPLGVSVDKWSMNVRGRSRAYNFADVFSYYVNPIRDELTDSLFLDPYAGVTMPVLNCPTLVVAANDSLTALPPANALPTYTDVQRIFNKSCVECHGGLDYPPYAKFTSDPTIFDLSEREDPPDHNRLTGSYDTLTGLGFVGLTSADSYVFQRITSPSTSCPSGAMPCGGPRLAQADVETIRRWLDGGHPNTAGDPHITTVDNVPYDFQGAGEYTLLRGEGMEIQARQTPIQTDGPLDPDSHSGLSSCPSLNTAAALRVGSHRVTYGPDPNGNPESKTLQLRIDGKLVNYPGPRGIAIPDGGRILPTTASGGIQVQFPGGTEAIVTPGYWDYYQVWFLNIEVRSARTTFGIMGAIAPRNWLPALPDGSFLGARPSTLAKRYDQIYVKFSDAWRVTKTTSLFDYAAGKDTDSYTLKGWPAFEPKDCKLPKGWGAPATPPRKVSPEVAKQVCAAIKDPARRQNCQTDVVTTGDVKFADTYLATEKIELNVRPKPVELGKPEAFAENLGETVDFSWKGTSDKDDGKLVYMHCLWPQGEKLELRHCRDLAKGAFSASASGLTPGKFYYWKVVVDDGQGATVDSEVRRFQVQPKK